MPIKKNESTNQNSYQISKLDAARRQLETAIRLFFSEYDGVSIHTLASAAHEILTTIGREKNVSSLIRHRLKDHIKEELYPELIGKMEEAARFFRHGSNGARKQLKFDPRQTEIWIWDACLMYKQFCGEMTDYMMCFHVWYAIHNSDQISEPLLTRIKTINFPTNLPKKEFIESFFRVHLLKLS